MKSKTDKKFLYGKGHICQYCIYKEVRLHLRPKCVPLANVYNYTKLEQGITSFTIIVFDCDKFKRDTRTPGDDNPYANVEMTPDATGKTTGDVNDR